MRFCNYRLSESRRGWKFPVGNSVPKSPFVALPAFPSPIIYMVTICLALSLLSEKLFKYNLN